MNKTAAEKKADILSMFLAHRFVPRFINKSAAMRGVVRAVGVKNLERALTKLATPNLPADTHEGEPINVPKGGNIRILHHWNSDKVSKDKPFFSKTVSNTPGEVPVFEIHQWNPHLDPNSEAMRKITNDLVTKHAPKDSPLHAAVERDRNK